MIVNTNLLTFGAKTYKRNIKFSQSGIDNKTFKGSGKPIHNVPIWPLVAFGIFVAGSIAGLDSFMDGKKQSKTKMMSEEVILNISPRTLDVMDSLSNVSKNVPKEKGMQKFNSDTIQILPELTKNPSRFMKDMKLLGELNMPFFSGVSGTIKPVIKNEFFKDKEGKFYFPVEFYGKFKPKYK